MKGRLAGGGIECLAEAQGHRNAIQRRCEPGVNRLGPSGGLHHATDANEQRIIEQGAQPSQGTADSGLADEKQLAGPRHAAFAHHGFENHQQIDIRMSQLVSVHGVRRRVMWNRTKTARQEGNAIRQGCVAG